MRALHRSQNSQNITAAISDGDKRNRANKLPLSDLLFTEASFGGLSLRSCALRRVSARKTTARRFIFWSWRRDLNPRPSDYKSDALPAELRQHRLQVFKSEDKLPETSRRTGQSSEIITAELDVQAPAGQRFPTLSHSHQSATIAAHSGPRAQAKLIWLLLNSTQKPLPPLLLM
jgi:hypothetical protein